MRLVITFLTFFLLLSCAKEKKMPVLDLMKYGLPISIGAPEGAVVKADDMGIMQDVTVKHGEDYFIQIYGSNALSLDAAAIFSDKKKEIEAGPFFSKIISEEAQGMIYEKEIDADNIDYDFVYVKIQGDKEFVFQTGLFGTSTLEQVQTMYNSVK